MTEDSTDISYGLPDLDGLAEPEWLTGPPDTVDAEPGAPAWLTSTTFVGESADIAIGSADEMPSPELPLCFSDDALIPLPDSPFCFEIGAMADLTAIEGAVRGSDTAVGGSTLESPEWLVEGTDFSDQLLAEPSWIPPAIAEPMPEAALQAEAVLQSLLGEIDASITDSQPKQNVPVAAIAMDTTRYLVFFLANSRFALPLDSVIEVTNVPRITAVPGVPQYVRGVTNLRGEILTVLDMRSMLGLPRLTNTVLERMLVVRQKDQETVAGFVVDRVRGLARLDSLALSQPEGGVDGPVMRFLDGVSEYEQQVLSVLDPRKLFLSEEVRRLAQH